VLDLLALAALNHLLAATPWARARLAPFAGRRARLVMAMPAAALTFRIGTDGTLESLGDAPPDVNIHLPAGAPLAALGGRDGILRGARIDGRADFAEALGEVLRHLDWDVEEDLSRLVGDIAAHRLAGAGRAFAAAGADSARRLADNLDEFFRYERPPGIGRAEAAAFAGAVALLRADANALERRLGALERRPV